MRNPRSLIDIWLSSGSAHLADLAVSVTALLSIFFSKHHLSKPSVLDTWLTSPLAWRLWRGPPPQAGGVEHLADLAAGGAFWSGVALFASTVRVFLIVFIRLALPFAQLN